jgi:hypothetical protein
MEAILLGGRGRRLALTLVLSASLAIGLIGVSADSASAATCTGAAAIHSTGYTLTGPAGVRSVTTLRGKVNQGDSVIASFTISSACPGGVVVSLVSYLAPGPTWDPNTANQQQPFDSLTMTFSPGPNSIGPVLVPPVPSCFQVDFVQGTIIQSFSPPGGTYSGQGRLVDADNGDPGCTPL